MANVEIPGCMKWMVAHQNEGFACLTAHICILLSSLHMQRQRLLYLSVHK